MRKTATMFSLLMLFCGATAVQAGEVVYRETETGIYVELTGEKGPEVKVLSREEIADMALAALPDPEAQKAADEKRRMEKLAQQKAKLHASRMKRQQEEE